MLIKRGVVEIMFEVDILLNGLWVNATPLFPKVNLRILIVLRLWKYGYCLANFNAMGASHFETPNNKISILLTVPICVKIL